MGDAARKLPDRFHLLSLSKCAVNARDAMQAGGKLTIETSNAYIDTAYAAQHSEVNAGQYVVFSVSDTGVGIEKEYLDRVFEPFFTRKEVGRGTGLRLSMVYGFAKQSGGHVKIYSERQQGTTAKIYLPRWYGQISENQDQASEGVRNSGSETILVVEDDPDVRAFTVEALRDLGYAVLEADDGPTALQVIEATSSAIALLFTDVVLPGDLNGPQLAERAASMLPKLKVLFTSGYSRNAIVHHGRLDAGVSLITKPFAIEELSRRLRELLDSRI